MQEGQQGRVQERTQVWAGCWGDVCVMGTSGTPASELAALPAGEHEQDQALPILRVVVGMGVPVEARLGVSTCRVSLLPGLGNGSHCGFSGPGPLPGLMKPTWFSSS